MGKRQTTLDVEDVLSSIRRLVSEEARLAEPLRRRIQREAGNAGLAGDGGDDEAGPAQPHATQSHPTAPASQSAGGVPEDDDDADRLVLTDDFRVPEEPAAPTNPPTGTTPQPASGQAPAEPGPARHPRFHILDELVSGTLSRGAGSRAPEPPATGRAAARDAAGHEPVLERLMKAAAAGPERASEAPGQAAAPRSEPQPPRDLANEIASLIGDDAAPAPGAPTAPAAQDSAGPAARHARPQAEEAGDGPAEPAAAMPPEPLDAQPDDIAPPQPAPHAGEEPPVAEAAARPDAAQTHEQAVAETPADVPHAPEADEPHRAEAGDGNAAQLPETHEAEALFAEEGDIIDEETLRDMVAQIVREELMGELGDRITRNVRKLVRREIAKALASRQFE